MHCHSKFTSKVLLFAFLFIYYQVSGQYHVRTQYVRASAAQSIDQPVSQSGNGFDLGVGYWFRLKNLRIEFLPEVSYGKITLAATDAHHLGDLTSYGAALPISVYPLELEGDCKCPTFSKQNDLFKKGFFIELVPAFQRFQVAATLGDNASWINQLNLGGGLGLDIGVSDLLTITPLVHYFTYLSRSSDDQTEAQTVKNQIRAGARFMFRLDY